MRHLTCVLAAVVLFSGSTLWGQASQPTAEVKGKVDAVTVYRGQALVTRLVEIPGPAGLKEVIVGELPDRVLPGSMYAESADGVEVRSVRYRTRPVAQDVREDVRKLDAQIRDINEKIMVNSRQLRVLTEQRNYLVKLETFVAPTATLELSKGVLNAETLEKLSKYIMDQRQAMTDTELKLSKESRDLNEQLNLLSRQREEVTGSSARTVREAVVFVNLKDNGGRMRLSYLVDQANWAPSYNVRVDAERKGALVEYNAAIQQMSGEDWTDVQMTLSTATPSLVAMSPELVPLTVTLRHGVSPDGQPMANPGKPQSYNEARQQFAQQQKTLEMNRSNTYTGNTTVTGGNDFNAPDTDLGLNENASTLQVAELTDKDISNKKMVDASAFLCEESVSVTYQLAARTSLPSRADRQLLTIASAPMKGQFFKVATPVLTSYIYEQAQITNEGKQVLLAGPVASYVAGQFVGNGQMPTVAIGQSFTVGLGIDSSLHATRELVEKTESVQGGNRVLMFNYKIAIENFGAAPATVRVMDRIPTAKESEVRVTMVSTKPEVSKDPTYQQSDSKKGILRWELEAAAQSIGPKAATIEYQVKVEYDKQMEVTNLPAKK